MAKLRQIQGFIFGLANSYPCEFRTRQQIIETFPPRGVGGFVGLHDSRWPARPIVKGSGEIPRGTIWDDTQMDGDR